MKSLVVKSAMAVAVCVLSTACSMRKDMPPAEPPMEKPVEQAMPAKDMPIDVKDVQKKLNMSGVKPKLRVDGKMGKSTTKAISAFQKKNSLPVTGELDAMTLGKLNG